MNTPERKARDPFAPVTRVELEAALAAASEPIREELASLRADSQALDRDVRALRGEVGSWREHGATKADVQAMGLRIVMWMAGLLAMFVAVMGWLVRQT